MDLHIKHCIEEFDKIMDIIADELIAKNETDKIFTTEDAKLLGWRYIEYCKKNNCVVVSAKPSIVNFLRNDPYFKQMIKMESTIK